MDKENKEMKEKGKQEPVKQEPQKQKAKPKEVKEHKRETPADKGVKHLVRVAGVVLNGDKEVARALSSIPGIGPRISKSLVKILGFEKGKKLGSLTEDEIDKTEKTIASIDKYIPKWMLNRRDSYDRGKCMHLIGADLDFSVREDINLQKRIKSYRGIRHILGQPVRGQRTRTSFRKGTAVGVVRKKEMKPATKGDEKEGRGGKEAKGGSK